MALSFDVEAGQPVTISGACVVTVEKKAGRRARLRIETSSHVDVGQSPDAEQDHTPSTAAASANAMLQRRNLSG